MLPEIARNPGTECLVSPLSEEKSINIPEENKSQQSVRIIGNFF